MSDILDWLERLSELFILKLLTLGAWSKAYERYRIIPFVEDYLHDQVSDELIEYRDLFIKAYDSLVHAQTVDEVVSVYSIVIEELLHDQVVDESVVIQRLERIITMLLSPTVDVPTVNTIAKTLFSIVVERPSINEISKILMSISVDSKVGGAVVETSISLSPVVLAEVRSG
jgi:hypothetical protein